MPTKLKHSVWCTIVVLIYIDALRAFRYEVLIAFSMCAQLTVPILALCMLGCSAQPFQPGTGFVPLGEIEIPPHISWNWYIRLRKYGILCDVIPRGQLRGRVKDRS